MVKNNSESIVTTIRIMPWVDGVYVEISSSLQYQKSISLQSISFTSKIQYVQVFDLSLNICFTLKILYMFICNLVPL